FVPQSFSTLALLSVLSMVTWKRKVQIQNGQARITLPKRWVEDQDLEDKDELEVETMKREKGLKITIPD
ncbi:MAG: AbrB/MazE/SpoVT family DNA-binding domain-containing protein, partial [Candidatus Nanohaloarchaea archaeon]